MLPKKLSELGYYNVLAADERRFSNMDEYLGFDKVVGPENGALDFLLGELLDIPLVNVMRRVR